MDVTDIQAGIGAMNSRCPFVARGVNVLGVHVEVDHSGILLCASFQPSAAAIMATDAPLELIARVTPESLPAIFAGTAEPEWQFDDEFN